jgi:very-short-patch-repair endonuclease
MILVRNPKIIEAAKTLSRDLRRRQTRSEKILWVKIRNRNFLGKKFYRQHPIFFEYCGKTSFFIADFYSHQPKLVIEIDGKSHNYQEDYDTMRTYIINQLGIKVVRFRNAEIDENLNGVLKQLKEYFSRPDP